MLAASDMYSINSAFPTGHNSFHLSSETVSLNIPWLASTLNSVISSALLFATFLTKNYLKLFGSLPKKYLSAEVSDKTLLISGLT